MKVQDVMTREVEMITPNASVQEAANRMARENLGALPVGENDRLIGVITDRDIVMRVIARDLPPGNTAVREAMSEKICYCFEDDELDTAARNMAEHQVRRLAVLNRNKRLVGLIALADLGLNEPSAAQTALQGISERTGEQRRMSH
jgi:CBS domain-containing protein